MWSARIGATPVACAAKCLIVMVKTSKRTSRYYLAVVPGDARVDMQALKTLAGGTYAAVASTDKAEALAGSVSGTILPFSFHPDLTLVTDPGLLTHEEIFFNAARLDRSLALKTSDYLRLANPHLASDHHQQPARCLTQLRRLDGKLG